MEYAIIFGMLYSGGIEREMVEYTIIFGTVTSSGYCFYFVVMILYLLSQIHMYTEAMEEMRKQTVSA